MKPLLLVKILKPITPEHLQHIKKSCTFEEYNTIVYDPTGIKIEVYGMEDSTPIDFEAEGKYEPIDLNEYQ